MAGLDIPSVNLHRVSVSGGGNPGTHTEEVHMADPR